MTFTLHLNILKLSLMLYNKCPWLLRSLVSWSNCFSGGPKSFSMFYSGSRRKKNNLKDLLGTTLCSFFLLSLNDSTLEFFYTYIFLIPSFLFSIFSVPVFLSLWFFLFGVPLTLNLFQWCSQETGRASSGKKINGERRGCAVISREQRPKLQSCGQQVQKGAKKGEVSLWGYGILRKSLQSDPKEWENGNDLTWEP